jgi:hypothetical protein
VPDADHARTLLLLRWADPLPGTPLLSRGELPTALVAVAAAVAEGKLDIMPEVLVTGGRGLDGLAATLMRTRANGHTRTAPDTPQRTPVEAVPDSPTT